MTRNEVRDAVAQRLAARIPALGQRVYKARTWPVPGPGLVDVGKMPAAMVYILRTRRVSLSGPSGAPTYRTTLTVAIVLRAEGRLDAEVDNALDVLLEGFDDLLTDPTFMSLMEDVTQIDSQRELRNDGDRVVGGESIAMDLQFTETFQPRDLPDLRAARIVIDAIDPADSTGPYPAIAPFPAPAGPPRDRGPDGRPEADEMTVTFNP
jgi:hypothetical protein